MARSACSAPTRSVVVSVSSGNITHPYCQRYVTPVQVFNRATDPFLPKVKGHTFAAMEDLDARGLRNHVLVITRYRPVK